VNIPCSFCGLRLENSTLLAQSRRVRKRQIVTTKYTKKYMSFFLRVLRGLRKLGFFLVAVIVFAGPSGVSCDERIIGDASGGQDVSEPQGEAFQRQDIHVHESSIEAADPEPYQNGKADSDLEEIGIVEKLGQHVPLDVSFNNEEGNGTRLDEVVTKPAIVALVFLKCRGVCPLLLGGLAGALGNLQLIPGKDYEVLTISFDDSDTPTIASEAKKNYIAATGKPYPEKAWRFLTGDKKNIKAFTDAVGFTFRKEKEGFSHPLALVVLSPKGKIIRYLYGTSFLPFDLAMSVTEASEEREGLSINRVLMYCFSYDPQEKKYVFNVLRVVGAATLVFVAALFVYLAIGYRRAK
jgi:protein SCO1/2